MNYVGIDLHKRFLVACVVKENNKADKPLRIKCADFKRINSFFEKQRPFKAVIEASSSYRWLYDQISPLGEVVLAHPLRLRAIISARAKTDKLDSEILARLLRSGMIPTAYIPPENYQVLRDVTRCRQRLVNECTKAKNGLHALLMRSNIESPFKSLFTKRGIKWLKEIEFGPSGDFMRDEMLSRYEHFNSEISVLDDKLSSMAQEFPEVEAISDIHGIGLYSALLIVAEIGEPWRFRDSRQVGCYAGLTARVHQSGEHSYYGRISKQGSKSLRWILIQAAMKVIKKDTGLKNLHTRIRKRSGKKKARVAVARKLACICWVRLKNWHRINSKKV